jgi:hypothetical protein
MTEETLSDVDDDEIQGYSVRVVCLFLCQLHVRHVSHHVALVTTPTHRVCVCVCVCVFACSRVQVSTDAGRGQPALGAVVRSAQGTCSAVEGDAGREINWGLRLNSFRLFLF